MVIEPSAVGLPYVLRPKDPETLHLFPFGFEAVIVRDEDVQYDTGDGWLITIPCEPEVRVFKLSAKGHILGPPVLVLAGPFHYRAGPNGEFEELKAEGGVIGC